MNKKQFIDIIKDADVSLVELGNGGIFGCAEVHEGPELPEAFSVIFDHGMTAVTWSDGTTTRTHCQGGDEFDPLFGIMACAVRKLTNNEGHAVDECEEYLREFADSISEPDDIDALIDFYSLLLDTLAVLSESRDVWGPQLGDDRAEVSNVRKDASPVKDDSEDVVKERERIRQAIRALVDIGEL